MGVPIVKEHTVPVLITAALPTDQGVCLFPLCRCHVVNGTVLPALYGRQSFIWVLSHVFPPFFLSRSPRKGFLPHSCGVFQRWHAPRTSGHFVPKWLVAVLPLPGYSFSDGHSVFKVLSIDELSQVYTFLTVCAVYPKGRKSAKKTAYFHALGIVVEWKKAE